MKLKAVRISGFRGIPPIDPPHVNISLAKGDEPQNVLIFGPNAFGKSSISSALEWFFRESVHCSQYFEDYTSADNVHVNVGKTGFPSNAYVEIDIIDKGQVQTVRKEIGVDGKKSGEVITGLDQQLGLCRDEIITLDHDEFRNFVSAASKDKWTTFASLIGYEELDNFRSGLDSISQRSLSDNLRITSLEKDISVKEKSHNTNKSQTCSKYSLSLKSGLEDIENKFTERLGLVLLSLQLPISRTIDNLDEDYWGDIRLKVIPSEGFRQNSERLGQLKKVLVDIAPISKELISKIDELFKNATFLETKKAQFDKGILSQFYKLGLEIIATNRTTTDECPFCRSPYKTDLLQSNVQSYITDLDFEEIQTQANELEIIWSNIKSNLAIRLLTLSNHELSTISSIAKDLPSITEIENSTRITSFNAEIIYKWIERVNLLQRELTKSSSEINIQIKQIELGLKNNPEGQLSAEIENLYSFWKSVLNLRDEKEKIDSLRNEIIVTKDVIEKIREIAKSFRDELEDFGGRVVEVINEDVKNYYDALHPNDNIKPFLETQIEGSKRKVLLKCDYKGYTGKDAASLLSESHRNSLGLAVLLAFMKYKRKS